MSAEIVETSKPYARTNAVIQPEWIEEQAQHLTKRRIFDPHWSRRRGAVMAWEQLSLYGLVLVEKRRVRFAPHDPLEARRLFIEHALVRGELDSRASFLRHNERVRREVEKLEHKRRRRDVVVDERAQFEFFDARIPEAVNSARSLGHWLEGLSDKERNQLHMSHDVLTRDDAGKAPGEQFPDSLAAGGRMLPLSYHFEPGSANDGVTLSVPFELLNALDAGQLQWLVPGLLREKLVELMRQLPKPLRRSLTPIPSFADALLDAVPQTPDQPLLSWLAGQARRMTGLELDESMFDEAALPDHLRLRFLLVDESGEPLEQGRDLEHLQHRLGAGARRQFMDQQGQDLIRDGETDWVFGDLGAAVQTPSGLKAWPALTDQGEAVGLRVFETREEANRVHSDGLTRLVYIALGDKMAYLARQHGINRQAQLAWTTVGPVSGLVEDLLWRSLSERCRSAGVIRNERQFRQLCSDVRRDLVGSVQQSAAALNEFLPAFSRISERLGNDFEAAYPEVHFDLSTQLADMVYEGFLLDLWPGRLSQYPRYFKAMEVRLERLPIDPGRDRQRMEQVRPWWTRYLEALERGVLFDDAMDRYRWLIEEFRVSLFAQSLGTREKVSAKRLRQAWQETGQAG